MRNALVALTVALLLAGCMPHKIPGTDLEDTSDTRAVLDVVNRYRVAVEQKNSQGVIDLAHESFRDNGGSASPDDDLDYASLHVALPKRFMKVDEVKLDLSVKRVEFDTETNTARVTYNYTMTFRMPQYSAKPQVETDIKQMTLTRVGDADWRIISGI